MKPIQFKQANVTFAKDQKEYLPLPACEVGDEMGQIITCWRLTWIERIRLLFSGKMWLRQYAFGQRLQPQLPQIETPFL